MLERGSRQPDEHRECSRKEKAPHEKYHRLPLFQLQPRRLRLSFKRPGCLQLRTPVRLPAILRLQRLRLLHPY